MADIHKMEDEESFQTMEAMSIGQPSVVCRHGRRCKKTWHAQMSARLNLVGEKLYPDSLGGVFSVRYTQEGDKIIIGFGAGAIQIRNPDMTEVISIIRASLERSMPILTIRNAPRRDDLFYAGSSCGEIFVCGHEENTCQIFNKEEGNEVNAIDLDVLGDTLASGGKDASLRLYSADTGRVSKVYNRPTSSDPHQQDYKGHTMRMYAVRFHPSHAEVIITGGWDDMIKVWDIRTPEGVKKTMRGPHICGDALDIRDDTILTGSWTVDRSLQLWDLGTGKLMDTITVTNRPPSLDGEFMYATQFLDGDHYGDLIVAGGSGTGALEVISISQKMVLGEVRTGKTIHALDSIGQRIAFGGCENLMRVAEFT